MKQRAGRGTELKGVWWGVVWVMVFPVVLMGWVIVWVVVWGWRGVMSRMVGQWRGWKDGQ